MPPQTPRVPTSPAVPLLSRLLGLVPARLLRAAGRWRWAGPMRSRIVQTASRWLRHRELVIPYGEAAGLRFDAAGANAGYALGTSEPEVQEQVARLLRPGAVFWDVGANVGFFTVMAARLVGPTGRVVAIEPVPQSADAIRRNAARNGLLNVTVLECAAGAATGEVRLLLAAEPTQARVTSDAGGGPSLQVQAIRLDEAAASFGIPAPDVVKIDVEGAECDVIRGMEAVLRDCRPAVLCEMHGRNKEFADLLRDMGYGVVAIATGGRPEDAPWSAHVLARPAEELG